MSEQFDKAKKLVKTIGLDLDLIVGEITANVEAKFGAKVVELEGKVADLQKGVNQKVDEAIKVFGGVDKKMGEIAGKLTQISSSPTPEQVANQVQIEVKAQMEPLEVQFKDIVEAVKKGPQGGGGKGGWGEIATAFAPLLTAMAGGGQGGNLLTNLKEIGDVVGALDKIRGPTTEKIADAVLVGARLQAQIDKQSKGKAPNSPSPSKGQSNKQENTSDEKPEETEEDNIIMSL